MRINKFLACATPLSRRAADRAVQNGRVTVDGKTAINGTEVTETSQVKLDGQTVTAHVEKVTVMLNKPVNYVCSRRGQGSKTIYELLPAAYRHLNPVGRLDKDSSGLLLLTSDGDLANQLTHPRYAKTKQYQVSLNKPLQPLHHQMIVNYGVTLEDGKSQFGVSSLNAAANSYEITMSEGRNRQIRRTFAALGYDVQSLHRTHFGPYALGSLLSGHVRTIM